MQNRIMRCAVPAVLIMSLSTTALAAWLTPIGVLDPNATNGYSHAAAISADGQWVVGDSTGEYGVSQPFRWSASSGIEFLGNPSGGTGYATGVGTRNGEVLISGNIGGIGRRWSSSTGTWTPLPPTSLCKVAESNSLAISADGSDAWTIGSEEVRGGCGGVLYTGGYRYCWSTNARTGPLQGSGSKVYFTGIAENGTAVGYQRITGVGDRAIYWTGSGTPAYVPGLGELSSQTRAVSADGQWAFGQVTMNGLIHAFKWEVGQTQYEELQAIGTGEHTFALASDASGKMIGGYSYSTARPTGQYALATIWDDEGVHLLTDILTERNVDLTGWVALNDVRSISRDGRTLCGDGMYDPDGDGPAAAVQMGYVAYIPEPTMAVLMGALAILMQLQRREHAASRDS